MEEPRDRTKAVRALIAAADKAGLESLIGSLHPWEAAHVMSRLLKREQRQFLSMLRPEKAADVVEEMPEADAAEILEEMPAEAASHIVGEMESDEGADLLHELSEEKRDEILERFDPQDKRDAIELLSYAEKTAGALMMKEYIAVPQDRRLGDILHGLRARGEELASYRISHIYVLDADRRLLGVLPLPDLLLRSPGATAGELMVREPVTVGADVDQEEVARVFERYHLLALPVVDREGRMVGILTSEDVMKVVEQEGSEDLLKFSGIVTGEEFRDMPLLRRSSRRLAWLSVNILLNLVAASVIWMHEGTLVAVIGIAMFLPIISDMSGCSGNQAVAVSIRELAVGLLTPREFVRVWRAEASAGLVIGLVLGVELGLIAAFWKSSATLGLIVGGSLWLNTILSVSIGGLVPLMLKGLGKDPALASSPILTTLTDLCGFFLVLSMARAFLT